MHLYCWLADLLLFILKKRKIIYKQDVFHCLNPSVYCKHNTRETLYSRNHTYLIPVTEMFLYLLLYEIKSAPLLIHVKYNMHLFGNLKHNVLLLLMILLYFMLYSLLRHDGYWIIFSNRLWAFVFLNSYLLNLRRIYLILAVFLSSILK